ncbi:LolA family protein [Natronobeatus ordinarius]|uniref:LolA family protein n=1 Tax=Natronobeatus ordinarius TaxID=2963433 RepID=UPI0020CDCC82|nr:DUF2092 domain-containing protein [Natronobeatus ordinarius]
MRSRRLSIFLCLLAVVVLAGCTFAETPSDEPDPDELWERTFVYDERLEDVTGERTSEATTNGETVSETVRVHERPFVDYRTEVLDSSNFDREGDVYVSNATITWWYDEGANAASYFQPDEPFGSEAVRDARAEQAAEQRDLVVLEYDGTETVADREAHVLVVEARNESVADGISLLVGDTEFVYALETVDPTESVGATEARVWLDAEFGYPLKEEVVFDVPGEEPYRYTERFETVSFNDGLEDEQFAFEPPADATVEEW